MYGAGVLVFLLVLATLVYALFLYDSPTCFDGDMNGAERGVDCGGACERICAMDVTAPRVLWAQSFEITSGLYNAVGYVENRNPVEGTKNLRYEFRLVDGAGARLQRSRA